MTANGLIATPYVPAAVTTAAATLAGWPVEHVLSRQPREAAVFTASPASIDVDLGAAREVNLVGLVATDADSWSLRAADTQAGLDTVAPLLDETISGDSSSLGALYWDVARAYRWWRVTLTGVPNFQLGRLVLADAWQPRFNFLFGGTRGRAAGFEMQEAAGGAVYAEARPQRRRWTLTWGDITDQEYADHLGALDDYAAAGGEVLFVRDPDPGNPRRLDDSLYCLLLMTRGATRVRQNRWRAPVTLEELT